MSAPEVNEGGREVSLAETWWRIWSTPAPVVPDDGHVSLLEALLWFVAFFGIAFGLVQVAIWAFT